MKKIGFAKIGKSIKFISNYSPIGGDNEPSAILIALANNNPDKTFYIIGRSDFSRLDEYERIKIFPYDNVIDCYKNSGSVVDKPNYLIDYFSKNNIKIDFAICMIGQIGTVTIPNRVEQIKNRDLFASVIDMTKNYSTPIINWLNESGINWIELVNDPRYTKAQTRDFISEPICTLSQYDYSYTHSKMKSFEDQDRIPIECKATYSGIETAFCIGRNYPILAEIKKNNSFIMVLNEGNPSRYNMLNEWILSKMEDIEIYGKWEHKETESDSRFKGPIKLDQVQEKVNKSKYTFIIPIKKGWVTSKYIEMIHAGCIPFFHPSYDEQYHTDVPDALRVKTPEELYNRIDYLERHPEVRLELLKELQYTLKEEYYNGDFINQTIMKAIYSFNGLEYNKPDITSYQQKELNTLF